MTPISNHKQTSRWVIGLVLVAIALGTLRFGIPIYRHRKRMEFLISNGCAIVYADAVSNTWWKAAWTKLYWWCSPNAVYLVATGDTPMTRSQISQLATTLETLIDLKILLLYRIPIEDADLKSVAQLKHLTKLHLVNTAVTDAGLIHIAALDELEELDLTGTKVSDAALIHLQHLKGLYALTLDGTLVTNAGLQHLQTLKSLRHLGLSNTAVTEDGVSKLHEHLPTLEVSDD